jgi:hypothetical protein
VTARASAAGGFAALLYDTLGHTSKEFVSVGYDNNGVFHTAVMAAADAVSCIDRIPGDANIFFGVNTVKGPARKNSGRGTETDITRLTALWCDLDIKPGGCPTMDVATAIIANLSIILGTRPSAIVDTGHGLHAYWPITHGHIADGDTTAARALIRPWGRLVAVAAGMLHVGVDNVYDLARMLRVPGTFNNKSLNGQGPLPVIAHPDTGGPLTMAEVDARLTEVGIDEVDEDREAALEEISPPAGWAWAGNTCDYVAKMIDGWATDTPTARRPWLVSGHIRLACAHRLGCLTEADHQRGRKILENRFTKLCQTTEPRREPKRFEIAGKKHSAREYGMTKAAAKTGEQASAELGGHSHADTATAAVDEETFWNSCDELTACRAYARAVRVGPWAMLGAALAFTSATIPPDIVLPGLVGDYASVNLYINLLGRSGAIKSRAIAAARVWLHTMSPPESVKPGSGQGIAKCFAYVKRTKDSEPVQVGKRWTAVAVIPEIDTLTAAGSMSGSSLWAELRSAWSDERVGHDYTDATKTVVLQPRRYRLCMIVGVQPLRSGPLFDDADAGTPQRFVWFPVDDPGAPDERPEPPKELQLPAWPADEAYNLDGDDTRAQMLDTPADRGTLRALTVPSEAEQAIDAVAREKLRGNPDIDPLDGHRLLCRLKVAAAIMRLCNRIEITSTDWERAGTVMAVSDRTREQAQAQLAADAARRNLAAAEASGSRKIVETRMAATAEVEDVARVAKVIATALAKAKDQTLPGRKVTMAVGRDRHLMPKALEHLQIDGRIKVEDIEYHGRSGTRITLLDDEEQTK